MSGKSDFVDYEPLKRASAKPLESDEPEIRRTVSRTNDEEEDVGFTRSRQIKAFADEVDVQQEPPSTPSVAASTTTAPVVRSGHMVSFIGLYLFTLLVFVRPYEFSPALMWLSRGALITALGTLIVFVPTQLGLENRITTRMREVNLVLLLLLLSLLSVPFAADKWMAWNGFVDFSKVVIMFVVMVNVVRTEKRVKALLFLVLVVSAWLSIAAISDYRQGNLELSGQRIEGVIGGLFDNPNDLALHLVSFFPIVIGLSLAARNPASKLLYLAISLLILAGTVVTFSRGGFLGLIAVFAALVWAMGVKNRLLIVIVTIVLVSVFLVISPKDYRARLRTTGDDSATSRTNELKRSIYLAIRHPVFGVGMGNYVVFSDTEHATHNAYTQVASELGLTAGVVYVLFLIAAFKRIRRVPHPKTVEDRNKSIYYLAIGLRACLVGYMVTSFFASVAYLWYVYYLVGYIICISRLCDESAQREERPEHQQRAPGLA